VARTSIFKFEETGLPRPWFPPSIVVTSGEKKGRVSRLGIGLSWDVERRSNRRPNDSVKNPSTYPHNEHRVVWATLGLDLQFVAGGSSFRVRWRVAQAFDLIGISNPGGSTRSKAGPPAPPFAKWAKDGTRPQRALKFG